MFEVIFLVLGILMLKERNSEKFKRYTILLLVSLLLFLISYATFSFFSTKGDVKQTIILDSYLKNEKYIVYNKKDNYVLYLHKNNIEEKKDVTINLINGKDNNIKIYERVNNSLIFKFLFLTNKVIVPSTDFIEVNINKNCIDYI